MATPPQSFILKLPDLVLTHGARVRHHRAAAWWWSRAGDLPAAPLKDVPTVLLIHALTGSAQAGGAKGWWQPLIGPGRPLDPNRYRLLCLNNLGSFYGSSAPGMPGFPKGKRATLTSLDQARALLQALDTLGIKKIHLAVGGSLGGMLALNLAALAPRRFERLMPIASTARSSAWVLGWNHVARGVLRLDPGYPQGATRGLDLARQIGMLTYRAEPGLIERQGYEKKRVASYLNHHGITLDARFTVPCYESQLDAMDNHDLTHPLPGQRRAAIAAIRATTLVVEVDSDQLFTTAQTRELLQLLRTSSARVSHAVLRSQHGHDGFLIEWTQLAKLVRRALQLPAPAL